MRTLRYALLIGALIAFYACSGAAEQTDPGQLSELAPQPIMAGTPEDGALRAEKGDVSGDGKADVWNFYKEVPNPDDPTVPKRVLVKKEADLNFDGRKDITRDFDADGVLSREEADLDYDGVIDQVNLYDQGILVEKRVYRGEGLIFMWKYYEEGKMVRLGRDDDSDGRPDYCELWYAGEKLSKKGWDKTGDGECDYWENAD